MSWTAESVRTQYSRFLDNYPNLLFANHSHQAWPNVAKYGHLKAFDLAADLHGAKWGAVESARTELKQFISSWIGNDPHGGAAGICWGQNTFDLVGSFLSALDLREDDCVVISDSEFHSMRRILQAYESRGVKVIKIPTWTEEELVDGEAGRGFFSRLDRQLSLLDKTKLKTIMFSSVSFKTGNLLPGFSSAMESLLQRDVPVLVDLYHHVGPMKFTMPKLGLENLYLVGGGYKYLQMGEGNCWMRAPLDSKLEPIQTGWFAEFEGLMAPGEELTYPETAERFRGATYEPCSILRAKEVASFFKDLGFTPESLQQKYRQDVTMIYDRLARLITRLPETYKKENKLFLLSHKDEKLRAGFVSLHFEGALMLHSYLEKNFIETDYRNTIIRFGPAPYTMRAEIEKLLNHITEFFEGEI